MWSKRQGQEEGEEVTSLIYGLIALVLKKKVPIPLVSVSVDARVVHCLAEVAVTQVYENKERGRAIEAVYFFPTNPDGAVTHFQAELDGRVVQGIVKKTEEARADYKKAIKEKKTAFFGEEVDADMFKLRVGFLKPGSQAKVTIKYVTEVKNDPGSKAIRFYIPTTIAPRYVSPAAGGKTAKNLKGMKFTCGRSPVPLSLNVDIVVHGGIKAIESPSHKLTISKPAPVPENPDWSGATVSLAADTTQMDRDFVVNILPEAVHQPTLYTSKNENGSVAAMLHLVPRFQLGEQLTELIFVLDRSGSMSGPSIKLARKALQLFLHSMPPNCYFNIVGFGSSFELLFKTSAKYDDKTLTKAINHAQGVQADLGGTELLEPLKAIYAQPGIEGYLRQIFVLTDGDVWNTEKVLGLAHANAHKARVFSLGIGDSASHQLVEGIAKSGGGTSAFVSYKESFESKVLNQLKNALQPSLVDIELEWEGVGEPQSKPRTPILTRSKTRTLLGYDQGLILKMQAPRKIPPIHDGSQLVVFGLFDSGPPTAVTIKAMAPDGPRTFRVESSQVIFAGSNEAVHKLAAVKLVRELELEDAISRLGSDSDSDNWDYWDSDSEDENVSQPGAVVPPNLAKMKIIEIGCKHGITSKYTSFVAVDTSDDDNIKPSSESWVMERRLVPSTLAHGWGGLKRGVRLGGGGCVRKSSPILCATSYGAPRRMLANKGAARMATTMDVSDKDDSSDDGSSSASESEALSDADLGGPSTVLLALTKCQSFDGSFLLDSRLGGVVGKALRILKQGAKKHKLSNKIFATALAIAYFEGKLMAESDSWELVVRKARQWLGENMEKNQKLDEVIGFAASCI